MLKKHRIPHLFKKSCKVKITRQRTGLLIRNTSDCKQKVFIGMPRKVTERYIRVRFTGKSLNGEATQANIRFFNTRRRLSEPVNLNTDTIIQGLSDFSDPTLHIAYIYLPPHAELIVSEIAIQETADYRIVEQPDFQNDILIITPMYPSEANPYAATFVASKVEEYKKHHLVCDIAIANFDEKRLYKYSFNHDTVYKVSFDELRNIIQQHHYKKILVHFLNPQIANTLRACDLNGTDIYIYCHGADVDFWNPDIYSEYFAKDYIFNAREIRNRQQQQATLEQFDAMDNVTWIFNTEWNYRNAQKATGIGFTRHEIIPCIINESRFPYQERSAAMRKKILVIKKMNNERQYAVDIAVKTILELSKKDYFKDLEITVVGTGSYHHELTAPLKNFPNVKIINHFIDNKKLNQLFLKNGILLAPSRYDTQGVTTCEAALSGMAVLASKGTGLSDIIPEDYGTFFENHNISEAVDIIDEIYLGKKDIGEISRDMHNFVKKAASNQAVQREITLLKTPAKSNNDLAHSVTRADTPLLSFIIPSYNAAQYLENGIKTLINQDNAGLLEILIIDDGSTDDTEVVVQNIIKKTSKSLRPIIKYIKKENGGHGSTINKGLELATSKYLRIMDADDRVDSQALKQHLDFLASTDADIVFTNTMHDLSIPAQLKPDCKYDFMVPHQLYDFDDLCYEFYGFPGYGVVLSTTSIKTDALRAAGCHLTEKCFYVDMEFNYYATLAAKTATFDPVFLYYYYLGRSGQSLANDSYKRNFLQYLKVSESLIGLMSEKKLSTLKDQHFRRAQLAEVFSHQYKIALDMYGTISAFRKVEQMMKRYPEFYNDYTLIPSRVFKFRHLGLLRFAVRKSGLFFKARLRTIKHLLLG